MTFFCFIIHIQIWYSLKKTSVSSYSGFCHFFKVWTSTIWFRQSHNVFHMHYTVITMWPVMIFHNTGISNQPEILKSGPNSDINSSFSITSILLRQILDKIIVWSNLHHLLLQQFAIFIPRFYIPQLEEFSIKIHFFWWQKKRTKRTCFRKEKWL